MITPAKLRQTVERSPMQDQLVQRFRLITKLGYAGHRFVLARFLGVAGLLIALAWPAMAAAQYTRADIPPVQQTIDGNGVNLANATFHLEQVDMTLGSGDKQLVLKRSYTSAGTGGDFGTGWSSNFMMYAWGADSDDGVWTDSYTLGSTSHDFWYYGGQDVDRIGSGWGPTSSGNVGGVVDNTGTKYLITYPNVARCASSACVFIGKILQADGFTINLIYENLPTVGGVTLSRLKQVVSSSGYGFNFLYQNSSMTIVKSVQGFSRSCNGSCTDTIIGTVSYSYTNYGSQYVLSTVTMVDGTARNYSYTARSSGQPAYFLVSAYGAASPSSPLFQVGYSSGGAAYGTGDDGCTGSNFGASSYRDSNGNLYSYSFLNNAGYILDASGNPMMESYSPYAPGFRYVCKAETYVATPAGTTRKFGFQTNRPSPLWYEDEAGRRTTYSYDSLTRLTAVLSPEGDSTTLTLDARGNPTEIRQKAKPGSGLADRVVTKVMNEGATIANCTTTSTCNSPLSETDANGNRANYSWSATHGKLMSVTTGLNSAGSCTIAGGVCPTKTYQYTSFTGVDGAAFYLPTLEQGQVDATTTRTSTFTYDGSNHFALKEQVEGSGGGSLRTCIKSDSAGNVVSKTSPRAGLAGCP